MEARLARYGKYAEAVLKHEERILKKVIDKGNLACEPVRRSDGTPIIVEFSEGHRFDPPHFLIHISTDTVKYFTEEINKAGEGSTTVGLVRVVNAFLNEDSFPSARECPPFRILNYWRK